MNKEKKEKWSITLIVLGIVVIIVCNFVPKFFRLPEAVANLLPIIGYVVGSLIILGGLVLYFYNYYKRSNVVISNEADAPIENPIDEKEIFWQNEDKEVSKHISPEEAAALSSTNEEYDTNVQEMYEVSTASERNADLEEETFPELTFEEKKDYMIHDDVINCHLKVNMRQRILTIMLLVLTLGSIAVALLTFYFIEAEPLNTVLIVSSLSIFTGTIFISIIATVVLHKKCVNYLKSDKTKLFQECDIVEGRVVLCKLFSHAVNGSGKGKYANVAFNNLYVSVKNDDMKLDRKNKPIKVVKMICVNNYQAGTLVKFYQNRNNPKKCYLNENID